MAMGLGSWFERGNINRQTERFRIRPKKGSGVKATLLRKLGCSILWGKNPTDSIPLFSPFSKITLGLILYDVLLTA